MEKEEKYVIAWEMGSFALLGVYLLAYHFFGNPFLLNPVAMGVVLALYVWASVFAYRRIGRYEDKLNGEAVKNAE